MISQLKSFTEKRKRRHKSGDSSSDAPSHKKPRSHSPSPHRHDSDSSGKKRSRQPSIDDEVVVINELNNDKSDAVSKPDAVVKKDIPRTSSTLVTAVAPPGDGAKAAPITATAEAVTATVTTTLASASVVEGEKASNTAMLAEAKGLKRTARKTLNRNKNIAKEMELVAQFKKSQLQPIEKAKQQSPTCEASSSETTTTVTVMTKQIPEVKSEPAGGLLSPVSEETKKKNSALVLGQLIRKKPKLDSSASAAPAKSSSEAQKPVSSSPRITAQQSNNNTPADHSTPKTTKSESSLATFVTTQANNVNKLLSSSVSIQLTSLNQSSIHDRKTGTPSGGSQIKGSAPASSGSAATDVPVPSLTSTSEKLAAKTVAHSSSDTNVTTEPATTVATSATGTDKQQTNTSANTTPAASVAVAEIAKDVPTSSSNKENESSSKPSAASSPCEVSPKPVAARSQSLSTETTSPSPVVFRPASVQITYSNKQSLNRTQSVPTGSMKDKWAKSVESYTTKQKAGEAQGKRSPLPTELGMLWFKIKLYRTLLTENNYLRKYEIQHV